MVSRNFYKPQPASLQNNSIKKGESPVTNRRLSQGTSSTANKGKSVSQPRPWSDFWDECPDYDRPIFRSWVDIGFVRNAQVSNVSRFEFSQDSFTLGRVRFVLKPNLLDARAGLIVGFRELYPKSAERVIASSKNGGLK